MNGGSYAHRRRPGGIFEVIGEPTRLQILRLLAKGERCVGELASVLDKEQSLISHHLRALKECSIVKERQEDQKVYYKLRDARLAMLIIDCEALNQQLRY